MTTGGPNQVAKLSPEVLRSAQLPPRVQSSSGDREKDPISSTEQLIGLTGVVKITHSTVNGTSLLNLDGFAPAARWEELSGSGAVTGSEVA